MATLSTLAVRITGNTASLNKSIDEAEGRLKKFKDKGGKAFKAFGKAAKLGAAGGVAAIAGVGVGGVKSAIDFENSLKDVNTLINKDGAGFDQLSDDVLAFSKKMGVSTTKVIPALYTAISSGVPADNVFEFMESSAKAAIGGSADLQDVIGATTGVVKGYNLSMDEAGHVQDLFQKTVALGVTTVPELAKNIGKVVPLAAALGVNFTEVSGTMATLTGVTGNTAEVSTQLRSTYQALLKPTKQMAGAVEVVANNLEAQGKLVDGPLVDSYRKQLNYMDDLFAQYSLHDSKTKEGAAAYKVLDEAIKDQSKSLQASAAALGPAIVESVGFEEALTLLSDTAGGNTDTLGKMFGSVEAVGAVLALTGPQAETWNDKLGEMSNATGGVETAFQEMETSTSRVIEKFKVGLMTELTKLSLKALPLLTKGIKAVGKWFEDNKAQIDAFLKQVGGQAKVFFGHFMVGVETIWPLIKSFFKFIFDNKPILIAAIVAVGIAILTALGPVSLAVIAIIALITTIGWVRDNWRSIWGEIKGIFKTVVDKITGLFNSKWAWLLPGGALIKALLFLVGNWRSIWGEITGLFDDFTGVLQTIYDNSLGKLFGADGVMATAVNGFKGAWDSAWDGAKRTVKGAVNAIIGFFNSLIRAWNSLEFSIPGVSVSKFGITIGIPGFTAGTPNISTIPKLARGTQNFRGGPAMVGERGPEVVNLPRGSSVTPNGGGGGALAKAVLDSKGAWKSAWDEITSHFDNKAGWIQTVYDNSLGKLFGSAGVMAKGVNDSKGAWESEWGEIISLFDNNTGWLQTIYDNSLGKLFGEDGVMAKGVNDSKGALDSEWGEITSHFDNNTGEITGLYDMTLGKLFGADGAMAKGVNGSKEALDSAWAAITGLFDNNTGEITGLYDMTLGKLFGADGAMATGANGSKEALDSAWAAITGLFDNNTGEITDIYDNSLGKLVGADGAMAKGVDGSKEAWASAMSAITGLLYNDTGEITDIYDNSLGKLVGADGAMAKGVDGSKEAWASAMSAITGLLYNDTGEITDIYDNSLGKLVGADGAMAKGVDGSKEAWASAMSAITGLLYNDTGEITDIYDNSLGKLVGADGVMATGVNGSKEAWASAMSAITSLFGNNMVWLQTIYDNSLGKLFGSDGVMATAVNGFKAAWDSVWEGAKRTVKSAVNAIIGFFNSLIRAWNSLDFSITGFTAGTPYIAPIPQLARGTQNFRGGPAIVGERGPEVVNLPRGSSVTPNGGGGGATINFYGPVYGVDDFNRAVNEARLAWKRAGNG